MDKVQSRYAAQLNQAQRFAAYSAGQNDAAASLALEREGVKSATVYGDEAGFVQSEHSASLPKETVRFYDSLARAAGVKIQMAEATGKGGANGWYSNGIIHIANDAENPGTVVAKHEITHRMQEMAPEAYRKYRDYAMSALTEQDGSTASIVEQYKSRYAEAGVNLSAEQAMDEIAAAAGLARREVTAALESVVEPLSLDEPVYTDGGDAMYVIDQVRDPDSEESWISGLQFRDTVAALSPREKRIMELRYLRGKTQMEVAQEIGISQAQVSRLEKAALEQFHQQT